MRTKKEIAKAWEYAVTNMRGDRAVVIVEEFIDFDYEITQLTVKERAARGGGVVFVEPDADGRRDADRDAGRGGRRACARERDRERKKERKKERKN